MKRRLRLNDYADAPQCFGPPAPQTERQQLEACFFRGFLIAFAAGAVPVAVFAWALFR